MSVANGRQAFWARGKSIGSRWIERSLALAAFLLLTNGCHDERASTKPAETVGAIQSAVSSGPNCTAAGDPTLGVDIGFACSGALAAATFTHALCACGTINDSNSLTTDGFDATQGGPNGGL